MALNFHRVEEEDQAVCDMASALIDAFARMDRLLAHNSAQSIDWGAGSTPAYITESPDGNISGKDHTRQAVGNAIGTFAAIQSLLDSGHRGNLLVLARAAGG